ncbi:MAG: hypothetical protein ACE5JG_08695, partial [Planctomycetota bacterium]
MLDRWRLILRYLPPYRRAAAAGFAALAASIALLAAPPLCLRQAVHSIEQATKAATPPDIGLVARWAAATLALTLLGGSMSFFKRYLLIR